ncbi:hypothetical protein AX774_g8201 [Zancudomyces culisetae]|uniref:Vta1 C-terminal domain-containing protein n=1 Tax=Zancudomyces culisetae TaxID=1213189 RepID=A0A1R1PBT1_ZANCU|nr:hypothetical protein AX774_g8201 [Zancudomyces culisetae]|eukprot:OMH78413.1 hypothetical protein AX774_g8201 [Zancudomyces culisetae]
MRAIREGRDPTLSIQTEAQPRVQTSTAEDQRETHSTLDATKHSFDQSSSTADKNKGSSDIGDISDILNFASPKATKSKKSDTSTPQEIKSFDEFKYPSFNHNDDLMSKPTISRPVPPLSPPSSGMMMSRGLEDTKNDYSQTLVTKTKGTATAAATPLISTSNSPTIAFSEVQPPVLDLSASKSAAKHARWAISALDYDDVETAIKNLELAINTLLPYRKR